MQSACDFWDDATLDIDRHGQASTSCSLEELLNETLDPTLSPPIKRRTIDASRATPEVDASLTINRLADSDSLQPQQFPSSSPSHRQMCHGRHLRTGQLCRNVALLPFRGVQPNYCAQHSHLEEAPVYHVCGHRIDRQSRRLRRLATCKEVIPIELPFCHKHIGTHLDTITSKFSLQTLLAVASEYALDVQHGRDQGLMLGRPDTIRWSRTLPKCQKLEQAIRAKLEEMNAD
eukprot:c41095_g1_i1.p1 GENE.c41095_g1_i1~~c41095_g1_i1.p1  ORF type:complete len:232 (+),score=29.94 c41095_g1_i1:96-791(+)